MDSRLQTYFQWPKVSSQTSQEDRQDFLQAFAGHFPLNSQVYILITGNETSSQPFLVEEMYSLKDQTFVQNITANCDSTNSKCSKFPQLAHRRRNLKGVELIFTALVSFFIFIKKRLIRLCFLLNGIFLLTILINQNNTQSEHCHTFTAARGNETVFEQNQSCNQVLWEFQRMLNFR